MSRITDNFNFLRELNEEFKRNIKSFYVCNGYHSNKINVKNIIITNDDMVYAFGDEHNIEVFRSLDNEEVRNHFIIEELCHQRVIDFRDNGTHLIARTFDGRLYYWDSDIANPQLIESLLNHNIIDIYCGYSQVIALTDNGIVFMSNFFGLDFKELHSNAFNGEKVKAISCGFTHLLALTETGCVYSWGHNPFGKSSFGAESYREIPTLVILNDIIIDKISCGQRHSLLLSRDGDIYAFEMVTKNKEFQTTPIKINNLIDIRTKNEKTESSQTKSFRENKFIDIATHSLNNISIALSVNGIYYVWSDSYFPDPEETDLKSFDEIFAEKLRITAKAIHIQSDNNFIPNDKYMNKFQKISQIGSGSYGKVFKVKFNSSSKKSKIPRPVRTSHQDNQNKRPLIEENKPDDALHDTKVFKVNLADEKETYMASGLKSSLHGTVYQLKLLMLFLKRGLNRYKRSFLLATEMDAAEKFDDVVLQYSKGNKLFYRALQAKHKQDETQKITANDLLTEKDDEFSLQKYFISYRRIQSKPEFKSGTWEDFTICTNIDFGFDGRTDSDYLYLKKLAKEDFYFERIIESDDVLNIEGQRYRFVSDQHKEKRSQVISKLKPLFEKTSEIKRLAKLLAEYVLIKKDKKGNFKVIGLSEELFKTYHGALAEEVIDIHHQKFLDHFLNTPENLSPQAKLFRDTFREAVKICLETQGNLSEPNKRILRTLSDEPPSQIPRLSNVQPMDKEKAFWQEIKKINLNLSDSFGKILKIESSPQLTDAEQLAEEIARLINKRKSQIVVKIVRNKPVIINNIDKLAGYVWVKKDEKIHFSTDFLKKDQLLPSHLKDFRNHLKTALIKKGVSFDTLNQYQLNIANFQTCQEEKLQEHLNSKPTLPNDSVVSNEEIEDFLNKLVFAVNQPNEEKLGQIINEEIGQEFNLNDADLITNDFQKKMWDWLKEKQGIYLSENKAHAFFEEGREKIAKLVLIGPTSEYSRKIRTLGITFKKVPQELIDFLTSEKEKQIFNLIAPQDTKLSAIKVTQALDLPDYRKEDSYIFIRLRSLLRLKDRVLKAFRSKKSNHLLVIECKSEENTESLDKELSDIVEKQSSKKIILITKHDHVLANQFKTRIKYEDRINESNFIDLTEASRNKLLQEKTVIFQGYKVRLDQLIDESSRDIIDSEALSYLVNTEDTMVIGSTLTSLGDVEHYYIDRAFNHRIRIKDDCFKAKDISDLFAISGVDEIEISQLIDGEKVRWFGEADLDESKPTQFILLKDETAEENFKQLCREYPGRIIHWLKGTAKGFIWQQSQNSLGQLINYVEKDDTPLSKINDRVTIIADTPGMGKSTILAHLAEQEKASNPALWVIRINLVDCVNQLADETISFDNKEQAIDFLLATEIRTKLKLEEKLFRYRFDHQGKIAIFLDGFDEISPLYKEKVIRLLQTLKNTPLEKIWITTRPHMQHELGGKLLVFSYVLKPFSPADQERFLKKFWQKSLNLGNAIKVDRLETYIKGLLDLTARSIRDQETELTGIPLQTRMIAEAFQEDFKKFYDSTDKSSKLPDKLDLLALYQRFIQSKYKIFYEEKKKDSINNPAQTSLNKIFEEVVHRKHACLALNTLFHDQAKFNADEDTFQQKLLSSVSDEELSRIGIVQVIDDKPHFIHRTFAEYFAADFFANQLTKPNPKLIIDFLREQIFKEDNEVLRHFLDRILAKDLLLHKATLNGNIEGISRELSRNPVEIYREDRLKRIPLHLAVSYGHEKLVELLIEQDKKSLGKQDIFNLGILSYWALSREKDMLRLIWAKATADSSAALWPAVLSAGNYAAFHEVVQHGGTDMVHELLVTASTEQKQAMLDSIGYTEMFCAAVQRGDSDMIHELLLAASTEQKQTMLSANDYGVFRAAVRDDRYSSSSIARELLAAANAEQKQAMLSADNYGVLRAAVQHSDGLLVPELLSTASKEQKQAMLSADNYGAFRAATQRGKYEGRGSDKGILLELLHKANKEQRQAMLSADNYGAFRAALQRSDSDMLDDLLYSASAEQKQAMRESIDYEAAFRAAVQRGDGYMVRELLCLANAEQKQAMRKNIEYVAAFRAAVQRGRHEGEEMVRELLAHASAEQQQMMLESINHDCLVAFYKGVEGSDHLDNDMVHELLAYVSAEQKQAMLEQIDYVVVFRDAVQHSDSGTVRMLRACANVKQRQAMLESIGYVAAFREAAQRGDNNMVRELLIYANAEQQQAMLSESNYRVFHAAVQLSDDSMVHELLAYANVEQQQAMLEALKIEHYKSFCSVVQRGEYKDKRIVRELLAYASAEQRQAMLSANNYKTFREVVQRGNGDMDMVHELLAHASVEQQPVMLESIDYVAAFRKAAQSDDSNMVSALLTAANMKQKQAMLAVDDYEAFRAAVQRGGHKGKKMVHELLAAANAEQQQAMLKTLKTNNYGTFRSAVQCLDHGMASALLALASAEQQQAMLENIDYVAVFHDVMQSADRKMAHELLAYASVEQEQAMLRSINYVAAFREVLLQYRYGYMVSELLIVADAEQKRAMLSPNNYGIYREAVQHCTGATVSSLLAYAHSEQRQAMLSEGYYGAFHAAVRVHYGYIKVNKLLTLANAVQQQAMLRSISYLDVFRDAVQHGDGNMVGELLANVSAEQQQVMLGSTDYVAAFRATVQRGDGYMVRELLAYASVEQQQAMLTSIDYAAVFREAVQRGYPNNIAKVRALWAIANAEQKQAMLRGIDHVAAFRAAVQRGDDSMVSELWTYSDAEQWQAMLKSIDYVMVFRKAVKHDRRMVHALLAYASMEQQQAMLMSIDYVAIFRAAVQRESGYSIACELLAVADAEQQQAMLKGIGYVAVVRAAIKHGGYDGSKIVHELLTAANVEQQQVMLMDINRVAAFRAAVQRGDSYMVRELRTYINMEQQQAMLRDIDYVAMLRAAIKHGGYDGSKMVSALLISAGMEQQQAMLRSIDYVATFRAAVQLDESNIVRELLAAADAEQQQVMLSGVDYVTVFRAAMQHDSYTSSAIAHELLGAANAKQQQAMLRSIDYVTAFRIAIQRADNVMVRTLISYATEEQQKIFWNNINDYKTFMSTLYPDNKMLLHEAARKGDLEIMKFLLSDLALQLKVKINDETKRQHVDLLDTKGDTPLIWAAKGGKIEAAQLLQQYGADVNVKNNEGMTALNWAVQKGHLALAVVLLNQNDIRVDDLHDNPRRQLKGYIEKHHQDNAQSLIAKLFSSDQLSSHIQSY
jgi:ankyrin repeat protein